MFKEAESGVVYWPVPMLASDANNELKEVSVHVGYRVFTRTELAAKQSEMIKRATDTAAQLGSLGKGVDEVMASIENNRHAADADHAVLMERVVGWRAGADAETGAQIELQPFSEAALRAALDREWLFNAMRNGLYQASRGAVQKNSLPGRAGTPAPTQA